MMTKGCGCNKGMAGVRKVAKSKRRMKDGACRFVISVSGTGHGPKLHATTKAAAVRAAKKASANGETAVIERKCGRKSAQYVASYEWGDSLD